MGLARSEELAYSQDSLIQGGDIKTRTGVLAAGQTLSRGSVIARITVSGKLTLATSGTNDGSQIPVGILLHDINASAADASCQFYSGGDFNSESLIWDAGYTDADRGGAFDRTPIKIVTPA